MYHWTTWRRKECDFHINLRTWRKLKSCVVWRLQKETWVLLLQLRILSLIAHHVILATANPNNLYVNWSLTVRLILGIFSIEIYARFSTFMLYHKLKRRRHVGMGTHSTVLVNHYNHFLWSWFSAINGLPLVMTWPWTVPTDYFGHHWSIWEDKNNLITWMWVTLYDCFSGRGWYV